jgi:hypothetical protein
MADGENNGGPLQAVLASYYFPAFYIASSMSFMTLCWNNLDYDVLRLLFRQLQFKIVILLSLCVMAMYAWRQIEIFNEPYSRAVCKSILVWIPLLIILVFSGMKQASRPFRIWLPLNYFAYLVVTHIYFGYVIGPTPITFGTDPTSNVTQSLHLHAADTSYQAQISGCLFSLVLLMLQWLKMSVVDRGEGRLILFPLDILILHKEVVPEVLLDGGIVRL